MKVLVLGSAGFVGSNICEQLSKKGYDITGIDNYSFGYYDNYKDTIELCISSLDESFLKYFHVIISSFCSNIIYAMDCPIDTYKNNVINGLKCFMKFKGKIVNLSTSSVYGNSKTLPTKESSKVDLTNAYSTSKYIIEEYLKERGNYVTLRLSNVYGKNQRPENQYCGVISRFIFNKLNNSESIMYDFGSSRDYTYVDDVVKAVEKCIHIPLNTEINIGTGIETTIKELCSLIGGNYKQTQRRSIDNINRRCLDITKAKKYLGWDPKVGLEEGVKLTEDWIKDTYFFELNDLLSLK